MTTEPHPPRIDLNQPNYAEMMLTGSYAAIDDLARDLIDAVSFSWIRPTDRASIDRVLALLDNLTDEANTIRRYLRLLEGGHGEWGV